jgi:hypothetical protein
VVESADEESEAIIEPIQTFSKAMSAEVFLVICGIFRALFWLLSGKFL